MYHSFYWMPTIGRLNPNRSLENGVSTISNDRFGFKLIADIDLQGYSWTPIGYYTNNEAQQAFERADPNDDVTMLALTYKG